MKTLFKSIDVLTALAEAPQTQAGVADLARATGIDKVIVHRILQTFVARDLVEQDPETRKYRLGSALVSLAGRRLAAASVLEIAQPHLLALWEACGETVTVSRPLAHEIVVLRVIESRQAVRASVEMGERVPLHATASGKLFLALGDSTRRAQVLGGRLAAVTPKTLVQPEALLKEFASIEKNGYAVDREGSMLEVIAVAAPIMARGACIGATAVVGPASRMKGRALADVTERLCETVRLINAEAAARDARFI